MKTITTPNGMPYISIIDNEKLFAIKLHEYDDVMVNLDKKVIPQLIEFLNELVIEDEILYNEQYDSYYNARTDEWRLFMNQSEPLTPENAKIMEDKMDEFMKASEKLSKVYEEIRIKDNADAELFWSRLSYEDKCNAFHAVVSKIFEGEIKVKGSYRYVLYDIFGFGPDMYTRGMDCGYMALHNSIMNDEQFAEMNKLE